VALDRPVAENPRVVAGSIEPEGSVRGQVALSSRQGQQHPQHRGTTGRIAGAHGGGHAPTQNPVTQPGAGTGTGGAVWSLIVYLAAAELVVLTALVRAMRARTAALGRIQRRWVLRSTPSNPKWPW
jgi:hypothetical protein